MLRYETIAPSTLRLLQRLQALPELCETRLVGGTVDCVTYDQFPWLAPAVCEDGLVLADVVDIAAMKLNAITNRGTRKDFVDLYFLLKRFSLRELMGFYHRKYPGANDALTLRSLAYFADAEDQPMPRMLVPFQWDECRDAISAEVRKFALS